MLLQHFRCWSCFSAARCRTLFWSQIFSVSKGCDIKGLHSIGYLWVSLFNDHYIFRYIFISFFILLNKHVSSVITRLGFDLHWKNQPAQFFYNRKDVKKSVSYSDTCVFETKYKSHMRQPVKESNSPALSLLVAFKQNSCGFSLSASHKLFSSHFISVGEKTTILFQERSIFYFPFLGFWKPVWILKNRFWNRPFVIFKGSGIVFILSQTSSF